MGFDPATFLAGLLTPADEDTPFGVEIIGFIIFGVSISYFFTAVLEPSPVAIGSHLAIGGLLVVVGWTVVTGRPIGLLLGFGFWFVRSITLVPWALEQAPDAPVGAVGIIFAFWLLGSWVLYRNRGFFFGDNNPDEEDR